MANFALKNSLTLDIVQINSENSISLKFCIRKRELHSKFNNIFKNENIFLQI